MSIDTPERKAKRFEMLRAASARKRGNKSIAGGGIIRILAALVQGPATREDLQSAADLSRSPTDQWVQHMRHAAVIRICAWELDRNNRYTVAVFELNVNGLKDEPQPDSPRMTGAQRSAKYRMRKKGATVWAGLAT